MSVGARLTVAGLGLAVLAVAIGVWLVPPHVSLGAGSIRCGTVLRPDRSSEVAPLCGAAGANHLRATLGVGGVLAVLALVPLLLDWRRPRRRPALWAGWAAMTLVVAIVGVASLGMVEYTPDSMFFDL